MISIISSNFCFPASGGIVARMHISKHEHKAQEGNLNVLTTANHLTVH